jgi:curli biogenesis system outer membrane secretion channel CsgG
MGTSLGLRFTILIGSGLAASVPATGFADGQARLDNSASTQQLASITHKPGVKPAVAIYEVRSTTPAINTAAATDMFTTALIKSRAFAVVERQRLNAGIAMERQLNATGASTGNAASEKIAGAEYVFEVAFAENNPNENQRGGSVNVGQGSIGATSNEDTLGMDVRIVSVSTSMVVDSVNVTKKIDSGSGIQATNVIGSLTSVFSKNRISSAVGGDAVNTVHRDGIDRAVRDCIETGVAELVKRIQAD